ncbi:SDR family oxidoreductase [Gordonia sp. HY285]|uniref:NAD(P)-dependent oxidoreductase n=1 Tax=Gordonia liuliyuniae TaxID=2911517 RepID=UPI001F230881|nr:NAD(P)-binding oxidoreductase [Gordonia liuliyuniae]MCF8609922.1 SDR family oxidoreductase [Gordonia liuliyuniae]
MRIVVIGANGNVGSRIVTAAAAQGNEVVAFVRRLETVTPAPGLTVVQGDASDAAAVAAAAADADTVVVSITGSMRDATFMQRTLPAVIEGVRRAGGVRIVLISVFGAGDTAEKASGLARLVYRTALKRFLADKAAADRLLMQSGLDYTIVYPVNLKDSPSAPEIGVRPLDDVRIVPGLPSLSYTDAGTAIAEIAAGGVSAGRRILLTTAKGWRPF